MPHKAQGEETSCPHPVGTSWEEIPQLILHTLERQPGGAEQARD